MKHLRCVPTLLLALIVTACGTAPAAQPPAPTPGTQAASATSGGAAAPKAPATVKVVVGGPFLSLAPLFVAEDAHLFEHYGVHVQEIQMAGGGPATEAVISGSADFLGSSSGSVARAQSKHVPLMSVAAIMGNVTLNLVISKKVAAERHLSRDLPLQQRLDALKGLTIGVTSAGSASDIFTRYFLNRAGLTPGKDTKVVQIGTAGSLIAALEHGQIDAFMLSPTSPEEAVAAGAGILLIASSLGDVPAFKDFSFECLAASESYINAHPDLVRAVVHGLVDGNRLLHDHPDQAVQILTPRFKKIKPSILKQSLEDVAPSVPPDGRDTEAGWTKAIAVESASGTVKGSLSAKEGVLWTNRFLPGS